MDKSSSDHSGKELLLIPVQRQEQELSLACERFAEIGLVFHQDEISLLVASRQASLLQFGRLQWDYTLMEKIIERANQSPYVERDDLVTTATLWNDVILFLQNQTSDYISDEDILYAVAAYYDSFCAGDIGLLKGKAVDRILINYAHKRDLSYGCEADGLRQDTDDFGEETDDSKLEDEEEPIPEDKSFHMNRFSPRAPLNPNQYDADADAANTLAQMNQTDKNLHDLFLLYRSELAAYVGNATSSVSEKNGRDVFASIQYTLSIAPKNMPVDQRFYLGQKRLLEMLDEGETEIKFLILTRLHVPLDTYNDTLVRAIPEFFRKYDAQYHAHETPSLMDYPLSKDISQYTGIVFILNYMQNLLIETEYVKRLPENVLADLIRAYGQKYKISITSLPVNLFEICMDQAFALALLQDYEEKNCQDIWGMPDVKMDSLMWIPDEKAFSAVLTHYVDLVEDEKNADESLIRNRIASVLLGVINFPGASDSSVLTYAREYMQRWISRFLLTLKNRCPENMILFAKRKHIYRHVSLPSYLSYGKPLDDDQYTELVEKMSVLSDPSQQAELVKTSVTNRKDLSDLLKEDFWIEGERERFVRQFSLSEKKILDQFDDKT